MIPFIIKKTEINYVSVKPRSKNWVNHLDSKWGKIEKVWGESCNKLSTTSKYVCRATCLE